MVHESRHQINWLIQRERDRSTHAHLRVAVPSLTLSDVIGDGEFVYHIWQDSNPTRLRIGRGRPSLTKGLPPKALQTLRGPMGGVVINKPSLRLLEKRFSLFLRR